MIEIIKTLAVEKSGSRANDRALVEDKLNAMRDWIYDNCQSYEGSHAITGAGTVRKLRVIFYFSDPKDVTWFELAYPDLDTEQ